MSDLEGTPYMTKLKNELNAMPTLLATVVAVIDEALYDDEDEKEEALTKLLNDAQKAADAKAAAAALETYTAPAEEAAAAETAIKNLKVIERSVGKDDKRKFTITFTPGKDIVMGGNAGPDKQGDQILITGLNNNGKNLPSDNWNLGKGEIWTDYNPKNATIGYTGDINKNAIVAGNLRFPPQGFRIWWKGNAANSDHVHYIEIDRNTSAVAEKPPIDSITFEKNRELQIVFTIAAPWPVPGSKPPYKNYQNQTGNKIGVQIYSKNTDTRPTATKAPLAMKTTLSTYFKGRAPNPDKPYPTVGLSPEEAADATKAEADVYNVEGRINWHTKGGESGTTDVVYENITGNYNSSGDKFKPDVGINYTASVGIGSFTTSQGDIFQYDGTTQFWTLEAAAEKDPYTEKGVIPVFVAGQGYEGVKGSFNSSGDEFKADGGTYYGVGGMGEPLTVEAGQIYVPSGDDYHWKKKEEAAAGKDEYVNILYDGYLYEIEGKVVPNPMGMGPETLEVVAGQTANPIPDPNEDPNDATAIGTKTHNNGQPLIIQSGAQFVQENNPYYEWILISNSGRESSRSERSLEEKLELMRSINVELVQLIKSKLL